jgi:hypothetical protein
MTIDLSSAQKNHAGDIAMVRTTPRPLYVNSWETASGREYILSVRNNVSLTWVKPQDVEPLLKVKKGCCGNPPKNVIRLATEGEASAWEGN